MAVTARFEAKDDGFDLLLGDRVILRHRVDAPAFRIAKGNPTVTMVRGNFRLEDAPTDERALRYVVPYPGKQFGLSDSATGNAILAIDCVVEDDSQSAVFIVRALEDGFDRIHIDLFAEADEYVWGGGEQMSYLALNGRRFPIWTSEPGVGREPGTPLTDAVSADGSFAGGDYWTTNYPEPTFLSSRGYSAQLLGGSYSEIDFTDSNRHGLSVWHKSVVIELHVADTPAELVRKIPHASWTKSALPDWAIGGAIVGLKDGTNSFARLEKIIAAGAAVSGLWCEDWVGIRQTSFGRRLFWDWQWNAERYPDLPARIAELKARGIRFLGYVNPYLAVDGPQYGEAARLGHLARKLDSDEPYAVDFGEFDAGVVDFTNPAAAVWFSEEIIGKQMLDFGLDGWMADFGEYLPVDLRLHNGDPMEEHNRWPVHWAKVNADAVASRGRTGDALFFMRAGFTGVQRYCPLLWAGDQSVDFSRHDGIGTVITAALSAGLVGNAYSHSDVGGYTSLHGNVRTEELMFRWYELGAFTPVMRTHEGNRPDDNLQIDSTPELLSGFVRWSRVHAALAPWVRHLCDEASATGLPAQRALFLHYPEDRETFTIQDQYLYGADLMVAPVIEEGAVTRNVYLPDGNWVHVWTGKHFAPGWHTVDAPIGSPPVFWRDGSEYASLFASLVDVRDSK
ncbi:MAG: alpha-glucosidase [Sphingomonadaceae bacterium]|nr:alpha-glucosidase [Sphingomonadaceae bacterium]